MFRIANDEKAAHAYNAAGDLWKATANSQLVRSLDKVAARIKREPDPFIVGIVGGWPRNFNAKRSLELGFTTAEKTFDDIIRIHIEDELGGNFVA